VSLRAGAALALLLAAVPAAALENYELRFDCEALGGDCARLMFFPSADGGSYLNYRQANLARYDDLALRRGTLAEGWERGVTGADERTLTGIKGLARNETFLTAAVAELDKRIAGGEPDEKAKAQLARDLVARRLEDLAASCAQLNSGAGREVVHCAAAPAQAGRRVDATALLRAAPGAGRPAGTAAAPAARAPSSAAGRAPGSAALASAFDGSVARAELSEPMPADATRTAARAPGPRGAALADAKDEWQSTAAAPERNHALARTSVQAEDYWDRRAVDAQIDAMRAHGISRLLAQGRAAGAGLMSGLSALVRGDPETVNHAVIGAAAGAAVVVVAVAAAPGALVAAGATGVTGVASVVGVGAAGVNTAIGVEAVGHAVARPTLGTVTEAGVSVFAGFAEKLLAPVVRLAKPLAAPLIRAVGPAVERAAAPLVEFAGRQLAAADASFIARASRGVARAAVEGEEFAARAAASSAAAGPRAMALSTAEESAALDRVARLAEKRRAASAAMSLENARALVETRRAGLEAARVVGETIHGEAAEHAVTRAADVVSGDESEPRREGGRP
jgi:hypothetical protein